MQLQIELLHILDFEAFAICEHITLQLLQIIQEVKFGLVGAQPESVVLTNHLP